MRKKLLLTYGIILTIGLSYFIYLTVFNGTGIPCNLYQATGIPCPACGITRMFLAMARLDFIAAFCYNPVVFTAFFYWNFIAVLAFIGKPFRLLTPKALSVAGYSQLAAFALFGIARAIFTLV